MDLRPIQVSSYPFIFEASGDSEDDQSLLGLIGCECNMSYVDAANDGDGDDDDDDDAESCSCDSWSSGCANGCVDDGEYGYGDGREGQGSDEDYDNDNDDEDGLRFREAGVPNLLMGSVPSGLQVKEETVDADAALREAMDAMENREFWETCLAVGYP